MSEWPNRWMVRLLETTDWGVDTACSCNYHSLCIWFFSEARIHSGLVIIGWAAGFRMGVARLSWRLRGVGVVPMVDAALHTTRRVNSFCEVPPGDGVLRLHVPRVAVGIFVHGRCIADTVEVPHWVVSAMWELFSEDGGWSADRGLYRLRNSFLEKNPSRQPVQKWVSQEGAVRNYLKAHAFVDSDD